MLIQIDEEHLNIIENVVRSVIKNTKWEGHKLVIKGAIHLWIEKGRDRQGKRWIDEPIQLEWSIEQVA